jgi:hypothetical protein
MLGNPDGGFVQSQWDRIIPLKNGKIAGCEKAMSPETIDNLGNYQMSGEKASSNLL